MKSSVLQLFIFISIILPLSNPAGAQINKEIIGKWNFKCPSAPEGFDSGIIDINKDSVFTTFVSITYKFPSTWIKVKKDSLTYNVNINGEDVLYYLKLENKDTINGKAVTSYGQSSLSLTKRIN